MYTFDSITLSPAYSDIESRSEVDVSTTIAGVKSNLPIINANMHAICTPEMMQVLSKNNTFSSYHRFFHNNKSRNSILCKLKDTINKDTFFPSIGIQDSDYEFVNYLLYFLNFKNILIDVNHGHHAKVRKMIAHIKNLKSSTVVMAGNVSTNDGIKFLKDAGADIIKIGNSFGFSCTTLPSTGFGVHAFHAAKTYREETNDWDVNLCVDGGVRQVSDIAKSLIYGNLVMLGKMFAGTNESHGRIIDFNQKEYYGNASIITKQVMGGHVKNIEGQVKTVQRTGSMQDMLTTIQEGLQSSFSFVGARNLEEYQTKVPYHILEV